MKRHSSRASSAFRVFRPAALLGLVATLLLSDVRAQNNLVVQGPNSPYNYQTFASYDNVYVGQTTTGVFNQTGGQLNVTTGQLFLGANAGSNGTYNLQAGILNTISTDVGDSGTGVFTLSNGAHNVTGTDGSANGSLDLAFYSGSNGTYNLNGGLLTAGYVRGGQGNSIFNFNGGTLVAGASTTNFVGNLTHAYIAGAAVINTNGYNVTIGQVLEHTNANNAPAIDNGLIKLGSGTLTLSAVNTYTGGTTVSAGTLALTGSITSGAGTVFNVDGNSNAAATLSLSGTAQLTTDAQGYVYVGNSAGGTVNQTGGTFTCGGDLILANASTSTGTYTIGGGSLSTGFLYVGYNGAGAFTQSGGSVTTNGKPFSLGNNAGSTGTYTLSGGTLSTGTAYVGSSGTGTFNQTGGSFTTNSGLFYLGSLANSAGTNTYTLGGTGSLTTGNTYVSAAANTSVFTQSGTSTHTTNTLYIGANSSSANGTYNLDGGTLTVSEVIHTAGTGTFNFNGGTLRNRPTTQNFFGGLTTANVQAGGAIIDLNSLNVTIAQALLHDTTSGAPATDGGLTKLGVGTLSLSGASTYTGGTTVSGGTLAVTGTGSLTGGGNVNVNSGATLALSGSANVSVASGSTLIVDGTATSHVTVAGSATLSTGPVYVGNSGAGTFNQTGGSVTMSTNEFYLGNNGGSTGTYTLSGGTLSTGTAYVGNSGTGTFNQTGGSFTTNGGLLYLGYLPNSAGTNTYNLGGTGSLTTGATLVCDDANTSVFTQSGTSTHTTGTLYIGSFSSSANGTYNLNGGTLAVNSVTRTSGTGTFNFNGGTLQARQNNAAFFGGLTTANVQTGGAIIDTNGFNVTAAQALLHDTTSGAPATDGGLTKLGVGTLSLSGASTYTGGATVNGGTLAVTGSLTGGGNVAVNAGATLALSGSANVSLASGSSLTVDGTAASPASATLAGSANLSTGPAYVGNSGVGTFTQTGGNGTTNGNPLLLGNNAGSTGTYTLSGGTLSTGTAFVGSSGTGTFNQTGGSFTTNGSPLYLGYSSNSAGTNTYNLGGTGSLTTGGTFVSDDANTSVFTQSGTSTHTTGTLYIGSFSSSANGTYNLNGGTLAVNSVTRTSGTGTFNFNGGTLQARQNNAAFFGGLTTANVQTGGAIIDTNGFNVTAAQALLHDTTSGAPATDGGLTKLGVGTLSLSGASTYTGGTLIRAGTLQAASDGSLGATSSAVTVLNGASLLFTGSAVTTARTFNLTNGVLAPSGGGSLTYAGATVNGGVLGAGNQILANGTSLAGVRTTTGTALSQSGGTVAFTDVLLTGTSSFTQAAGATLNTTGDFTANPQTTLTVNGAVNTQAGGSISGGLTINNGGSISTGGGSSSPLFLDGSRGTTINAGGSLNAASGSTVELGGLLVNNGAQTGVLDINLGGIARGSGSYDTVNVKPGGQFGGSSISGQGASAVNSASSFWQLVNRPAAQPFIGPLPATTPTTVNVSNLTLNGGSFVSFNLQNTQQPAGVGYDLINVGNALTISAGATPGSQIVVRLNSLDANGNTGAVVNFDGTQPYQFTLVQTGAGITGYTPGEFVVNTGNFYNSTNGGTFSVVQSGNTLLLVFVPVPEPGAWVLLLVGAAGLLLIVRRRSRRIAA